MLICITLLPKFAWIGPPGMGLEPAGPYRHIFIFTQSEDVNIFTQLDVNEYTLRESTN